jgi:hypothetical protein
MIVKCRAGCKREFEVLVTEQQLSKWRGGMLIQKAMPNLSPDQRELLISGTCGECWEKMFKEEEE